MRILICGGHLTPALAVIQALPQGTEILYVGRKHALEDDTAYSLEYQTIKNLGIPFSEITTMRFSRNQVHKTLAKTHRIGKGFWQAYHILQKFKPDVIVAFGSYVAIPLCIVGKLLGIPLVIHEQTLSTGLTNKLLSTFATKICISFPSSQKYFPKQKTILTGNPVMTTAAEEMKQLPPRKTTQPTLVIVGGSQGSHAINMLLEPILVKLLTTFRIIHQTGDAQEFGDYNRFAKHKQGLPQALAQRYILEKFIDPKNIVETLYQADIVVSRAGINTILTLLLLEKPTLFIPLPHGQKNEQLTNAVFFEKSGLGKVLEQNITTPEKLYKEIIDMYAQRKLYTIKNKDMIHMQKNAAQNVVAIIKQCKKN